MADFEWISSHTIRYRGVITEVRDNGGWGVVDAMNAIDKRLDKEEEDRVRKIMGRVEKERAEKLIPEIMQDMNRGDLIWIRDLANDLLSKKK